jgi:hypothetical protein
VAAERDLRLVKSVVQTSLVVLSDLPDTLANLCSFQAADFGKDAKGKDGSVLNWKHALLSWDRKPTPEKTPRAARQAASGAWLAWNDVVGKAQDSSQGADPKARLQWVQDLARDHDRLRDRVNKLLAENRTEGVRTAGAGIATPLHRNFGRELGDALRRAHVGQLVRGVAFHAF